MAGFLDKNTQIIDMILTNLGKKLYSTGKLRFAYYAFSDDGVDYNPYISTSGSLTSEQLVERNNEQIEATLVREAVTGYEKGYDNNGKDYCNIQHELFTMPQGQQIISELDVNPNFVSASLSANQQKIRTRDVVRNQEGTIVRIMNDVDKGFKKFNSTRVNIDFDIKDFYNISSREGFHITMFHSSSTGLNEIVHRRDMMNIISYEQDIQFYKDEELNYVITKDIEAADNNFITKREK